MDELERVAQEAGENEYAEAPPTDNAYADVPPEKIPEKGPYFRMKISKLNFIKMS